MLVLVAVNFAFAGLPLSLQQALDEGLKGNLDIKRFDLGSDGIDAQVNAAFRSYLPQLNASGTVTRLWANDPTKVPIGVINTGTAGFLPLQTIDYTVNWNVQGGLELKQFLYVPQALTGIAMAKKGKEIAALGKQELREGIIYGIAMQYWTIVYMEENLNIMQKSKENLSKTREAIASMVEQGIVKKSDLNTMDINLASLNTQIDNLKVQIQTQKDALLQIMGRAPGAEVDLTDRLSVDARNPSDASGDPLQSSITLKRMEQEVKLQEMQIDLTRQKIYPNVVAFASYGTQANGEKFNFFSDTKDKFADNGTVGVAITVPIFDGMSNSAERTYARIQKQQLEIDMEKQKLALQATYETAKSTLLNAQNLVLRNRENAKLSEENYLMKELEYKEQVAPITDLLTADNNMQTARSDLISALYTEKSAELALEQVLGILRNRAQ
uniref:Outer membrane protein, RND efflux system n=1 Tax=uncultured bacterium contig00016 TaxID=1181507 RepID=A0A806JZY0_9BACT|nr:outer membrane protein, RND efflux system precursor [uncultured bacterium contig00016]